MSELSADKYPKGLIPLRSINRDYVGYNRNIFIQPCRKNPNECGKYILGENNIGLCNLCYPKKTIEPAEVESSNKCEDKQTDGEIKKEPKIVICGRGVLFGKSWEEIQKIEAQFESLRLYLRGDTIT